MESFRISVIDKVKRPVAWIQENFKEKVNNSNGSHPNANDSKEQDRVLVAPNTPPPTPAPPKPASAKMSSLIDESSKKQVCEVTAKRRLAFQKSYSLEHGANWRRRSLIEDAKFDTVTNKEFEKQERTSASDEGNLENEVFTPVAENGCETEQETNTEIIPPKKCTVIFAVRDMSALSRVFKSFENTRAVLQHVESRRSHKKGSKYEFLVNFEAGKDALQNVMMALKKSSVVTDVLIVSERDKTDEASVPWFPRHITDLDHCTHLLTKFDPDLDYDHPGFADKEYRNRRKEIAEIAFTYKRSFPGQNPIWPPPQNENIISQLHGMSIPRVEYLESENKTWNTVYTMLEKIYPQYACKEQIRNIQLLEKEGVYSANFIPQLEDVSNSLKRHSGFQLRPVAGLLTARDFLASLAFRVFQCTQYVRHGSKPDHTVEPDCIHELLGHVPMLAEPTFAQFSQDIGVASLGVSDEDIEKLATLYWFTVEFGLCKQDGVVKAYGAGLLSAFGELQHALSDVPERRTFDPAKTSIQPYQDQDYQSVYFVAESFEDMKERVSHWAASLKRPYQVRYEPFTQSIRILDTGATVQEATRLLKSEINSLHCAVERIEAMSVA